VPVARAGEVAVLVDVGSRVLDDGMLALDNGMFVLNDGMPVLNDGMFARDDGMLALNDGMLALVPSLQSSPPEDVTNLAMGPPGKAYSARGSKTSGSKMPGSSSEYAPGKLSNSS